MGTFDRVVHTDKTPGESFTSFVEEAEPRLKRALCVGYGIEAGVEATADALAYGWEHWDRIEPMENRAGYLYRVGRSRARKRKVPRPDFPALPADASPWIEPGLPAALGRLSDLQRQSVWLVHGFEWTLTETASRIEADPAGRGTGHPPMYHFGPGLVIAQRDGYVIGALPPDAAVVSTMLRDGTSVWQRPVSGLSLWEETGSDVFTVLNEEGSEILRIEFDGDELPLVTRP